MSCLVGVWSGCETVEVVKSFNWGSHKIFLLGKVAAPPVDGCRFPSFRQCGATAGHCPLVGYN